MDRDLSTPFSSLVLSAQVFKPPSNVNAPRNFFDRPSDSSGHYTQNVLINRNGLNNPLKFNEYLLYDELSSYGFSNSKRSNHSVKMNKPVRVPGRNDNCADFGGHGLISEGTYNSTLFWPSHSVSENQGVAGKLLVPNFSNMKATCGQRGVHNGVSLAPTVKSVSSLNGLVDLSRAQHNLNYVNQNSYAGGASEMVETTSYDILKTGASKLFTIQREKCLSVTYSEQPRTRSVRQLGLSAHNQPTPRNTTSFSLTNVDLHSKNGGLFVHPYRIHHNQMKDNSEVNENSIGTKNKILSSKVSSVEENSEEFISRPVSPDDDDDDDSVRDCDSQAWDDYEDDIDGDDDAVDEAEDTAEPDDDLERKVPVVSKPPVRPKTSVSETASPLELSTSDKCAERQLNSNFRRHSQTDQQKRLCDNAVVNKSRPLTSCTVAFNSSPSRIIGSPSRSQKLVPKRGITRPPTAGATPITREYRPPINNSGSSNNNSKTPAPFRQRKSNKVGQNSPENKTLNAVHPSLFTSLPPTLVFAGDDQSVAPLPRELRNLLRWRTSTITPNVLKKILARSNFKLTSKDDVWLGCWGKHMKQEMFKAVREFQKFNHFPGSFQIGRKDRLWRNLAAMQARFGRKEFGFFPQTFILPSDYKLLKRVFEEGATRQRWILKPPASARGNGIRLVCSLKQIPKKRPVIIQKYIHQPFLINDSKFDIRLYVYVACYDPLRAYIFTDGLARFASAKYSAAIRDLPNKYMHLTNYSINKHNSEYESNADEDACRGHKWTLHALWSYLSSQASEDDDDDDSGVAGEQRKPADIDKIWASIKDIAVKALLAAEQHIVSAVKMNVVNRYAVHELFGFDILLDKELKPWLIEVNISPSLHSDSSLDMKVKGEMLKDLLNMAGYRLPDPSMIRSYNSANAASNSDTTNGSATSAANENINSLLNSMGVAGGKAKHFDPRLVSTSLSVDERNKHSYFTQNWRNDSVMRTLLDTLTPDDARLLVEFEDERSRMGGFEPLFPTTRSRPYLRMIETPRYYNLLLDAWLRYYGDDVDADGNAINRHEKGLDLLNSLCRRGLHLENPTSDWRHIWRPPTVGSGLSQPPPPVHRAVPSSATCFISNSGPSPTSSNGSMSSRHYNSHSQSTSSLPNLNEHLIK